MREAIFLTLEECLRLYEELVRRFGGSSGLRDPGLLESALARPRSGYYRTLFEQAAALLQSLAMNHCFVDGNKRMAMGCAFIFLDMNGIGIEAEAEEAERFLLEDVIRGKADVAGIAEWLASHAGSVPADEDPKGASRKAGRLRAKGPREPKPEDGRKGRAGRSGARGGRPKRMGR